MKARLMKLLGRGIAAWLLTLVASTTADAASITIVAEGLGFQYFQSTGELCDTGGNSDCGVAASAPDPVNSLIFVVDGVPMPPLSNAQLNVLLLLPAGTDPTVTANTAILDVPFDVFDVQINNVPALLTDVTSGSVSFSDGGQLVSASGTSEIFDIPSLPFGLIPTNPISWSFSGAGSCSNGSCTYSGRTTYSFQGEAPAPVPEPSSMILFGTGAAVAGLVRRRRRLHLNRQ
jgi:hypothetical protein